MKAVKNHPYASGEMEITLPVNTLSHRLTREMELFRSNVSDSKVIRDKYGNVLTMEELLTIKADTATGKKKFSMTIIVSDGAGDGTRRERELSMTPEEESYFFKEALDQVTENYLNIMENSAVCPMACQPYGF